MKKGKRMKKSVLFLFVLLAATAIFFLARPRDHEPLLLHGNVDQREIALAFPDSERIAEILVEEGSIVKKGQILARLDTRRLHDRMAIAEAGLKASEASLLKLRNGTRPEEKEQAKASLHVAEADRDYAEKYYARLQGISESSHGKGIRKSELDEAYSRLLQARSRVTLQKNTLRLAEIGPRYEDILQAEALVEEKKRHIAQLKTFLDDANLTSPCNSRVERRLLEAGDYASPQKPVFSLVVLTPKWIRAYISETRMSEIHQGTKARIRADSISETIDGTVTFIASSAEFTPKNVETEDLRTSLVYEVRIRVDDPRNLLRLGQPVTVYFHEE